MDEFCASLIIQWYEDVERRLIEFLSFIPLIPKNFDVFSPRLTSMITEACDVLDSLFREVSPSKVTIDGTTKKRKNLKIGDYAKLYANRLSSPITRSFVFVSPPRLLTPFSAWDVSVPPGQPYPTPPWWTVYNKQKHSRLQDAEKATLINVVEALCGLHQVIAKLCGLTDGLAEAILRHGWVQTGEMNPHPILETLKDPQHIADPHRDTYIVESKLFALPIGPYSPFPENINDLQLGSYHPSSPRLGLFLGRWF